ncbi:MAG: putative ABC transporter permease [Bacilli bacterium]|nr:putative ABC transporter permease [Bacilli bacterium]
MYYIKYFFLTSILGFFLESVVWRGHESGILYGPWTPVYGIGSIIIIFLSDKILKKKNLNCFIKFVILIFSCILLLSLAELVGGLLIEKLFCISFWDYSNYKYNVGKYICLEMSIIWGIASIIFVVVLRPVMDIIIRKIPDFIVYFVLVLFLVDLIFTFLFKY